MIRYMDWPVARIFIFMKNKSYKLMAIMFTVFCIVLCSVTYWLYQNNENDKRFECYSLTTFPKAPPVGNLTLLTHFILNQDDEGVITFTGENDDSESKLQVSREVHFDYRWMENGKLNIFNINVVINQSDTISNDVFKANVFNFQRPEIHMFIHRFKNSYVLGSLSSPISMCVDKDNML